MTDNNATQPAEKVGPIRQWIKDHPNIWEFILFNVLSNISTITRFVVTWIGTAIFISGMGLTSVPGLGHGRWHCWHHRFRGQHPARRDRELPAAQVLGYAEEQGLQGDGQERGGRQVSPH